ncbi:MAG: hypothetical protein J0L71_21010, partial [Candidatus Accumulibacter sp.]|nr:hypothetical protein [Accumulibacter sp.]
MATNVLLESREWVGEFFAPDQYEKRFPGKLSYSPEDGVILSYAITGSELPSESALVHGVLDTGDKVISANPYTKQAGRIKMSHLGRSGFRSSLDSTACMASLPRE